MSPVEQFERAFGRYVGADHAIALCNGTATIHTALVALGVKPGDRVAVPPLTMASTTIAVLHASAVPVFVDVDADTWLMDGVHGVWFAVPVSLYGLHHGQTKQYADQVDDAAQTLRPHDGYVHEFTSYSFQSSKILALGEGGMLVTNDPDLARKAREFSSLGYRMGDGPTIDKRALKDPGYARHHSIGFNYRMSAVVAELGLRAMAGHVAAWRVGGVFHEVKTLTGEPLHPLDSAIAFRKFCAALYRDAVADCPWITPQHVPAGWQHDMWSFAVALEHADLWRPFADAIERHGGTRPFAAWRITYQEPAFRHLAEDGTCPVAEDLQPRIVAFQTNDTESAKRNAHAVDAAIYELNGVPA